MQKQFLVLRNVIKDFLNAKIACYLICAICTVMNIFTTVINFCPPSISGMLWGLNIMMMILCLSED